MQSIEPDEEFLNTPLDKLVVDAGFYSLYEYLETIVGFLDSESQKHRQSIDEVRKKLESGEITYSDDGDQMPPEWEYDHYRIERILDFQNTLFNSFFLTLYIYLEAELARYCRDLAKQNPQGVLLSDLKGMNGVEKFMTYLIKVQHIEFSKDKSHEWKKIQGFNLLRNCIVHNQGRIDEGFGEREKLFQFIQKPDSKIELEGTFCVLNKEFCLDALDTIKAFLYSVISAKAKVE